MGFPPQTSLQTGHFFPSRCMEGSRICRKAVHRQQQIRNLSPKRCHPVHRLFAYITVQKNTVRFHIFRFPLQNFNFPDKYGKHQTVSSFLMLIIGTELSVSLQRTPYVISGNIDQPLGNSSAVSGPPCCWAAVRSLQPHKIPLRILHGCIRTPNPQPPLLLPDYYHAHCLPFFVPLSVYTSFHLV